MPFSVAVFEQCQKRQEAEEDCKATLKFFIQSVTLNSGTDYFDVASIDRPKDF